MRRRRAAGVRREAVIIRPGTCSRQSAELLGGAHVRVGETVVAAVAADQTATRGRGRGPGDVRRGAGLLEALRRNPVRRGQGGEHVRTRRRS